MVPWYVDLRYRSQVKPRRLSVMTSVEVILIVTGVVAAVGAVVGAVAAILDLRATKRSVELAEDQAQTRPELEVTMELREVHEVEDTWEPVAGILEDMERKAEKERKEKERRAKEAQEQRERERQLEKEEQKEQEARERRIREGKASPFDKVWGNMPGLNIGLSRPVIDPSKILYSHPANISSYFEKEPYSGPLPHKVVVVRIGNRGRIAAYDVTGWLYFNADHLEPLQEFSNGDVAEKPEDGFFKVEVGFSKEATILPTPNDDQEFSIAVVIRSPGTTKIGYEFQTPQGDTAKDEQELELVELELPDD